MSCCGRGRSRTPDAFVSRTVPRRSSPARVRRTAAPGVRDAERSQVLFEYVGATGLTARGPRTGRSYRFQGEGAVVAVDARDAEVLEAIPRLRRLR